jgi:DNA-binding IscR family transcriptional regulator
MVLSSRGKYATRALLHLSMRYGEGPIQIHEVAPISCVSVSGYMECGCPEPERCGLRAVWKEARDAVAAILDGTTFGDILDRQAERPLGPGPGAAEAVECLIPGAGR